MRFKLLKNEGDASEPLIDSKCWVCLLFPQELKDTYFKTWGKMAVGSMVVFEKESGTCQIQAFSNKDS